MKCRLVSVTVVSSQPTGKRTETPVGSQMVHRGGVGDGSAREAQADRWWQAEGHPGTAAARSPALAAAGDLAGSDLNMPRIVRSRLRG